MKGFSRSSTQKVPPNFKTNSWEYLFFPQFLSSKVGKVTATPQSWRFFRGVLRGAADLSSWRGRILNVQQAVTVAVLSLPTALRSATFRKLQPLVTVLRCRINVRRTAVERGGVLQYKWGVVLRSFPIFEA